MDLPEAGAPAAHVWLDILSTWSNDGEAWAAAVGTATRRFLEIGSVTVEPPAHIDASHMVGSAAILMQLLAAQLLDVSGRSRDDLIAWLREQIDGAQ